MRARLLVVVSVLVGLLVVGLGVPLAVAAASGATTDVFVDRLGDTTRFAALAQRPVSDDDVGALGDELARYEQLYGITAAVVDRQGAVLVASRPGPELHSGDRRIALALVGQRSEPYPTVWPWDTAPMELAEPVLLGGEVRGAAVTVSPTGTLRRDVLVVWGILVAAGLAALGMGVVAARTAVRWILAPVDRLDAGTAGVADAVRAGRVPEPIGDARGPAELRRLSRHFDQMAAAVTQAMETQRAFVADAGHQLRNPLTALRLRLQNVGAGLDDAELYDEHVAALEEADRLSEVLDALLALARAEGRPPVLTRLPVDPILDGRSEAWSVLARHEGLELRRAGPSGLVVESDPDAVVAVLDAVLDNAVKYAPAGSAVELSAARVESCVEIAVRDHGRGLDPAELDRATDRFWRSPEVRSIDGTGLGLTIAARSAGRAGGDLALELPDGGGLRVVLRLPVPGGVPDPAGQVPLSSR